MPTPPSVLEAPPAEYDRIHTSVAVVEFPERGVLNLTGPDGREFLQGLVTSDVQKLVEGRGAPAAILTPVGKILAMLDVFQGAPDVLCVLLQDDGGPRVLEFFERYRFNEMIEITDLSGALTWLSLQGPEASAAAEAVCGAGDLAPHDFRSVPWADVSLRVARVDEVGVPGFHLLIPRDRAPELRQALGRAAEERRGGPAGLVAWHACRVQAGVPWMGAELDESVLPMDAGLLPILDLEKGCYIGQEVVSRVVVQGRPNWGLWGVRVPPEAGITPGQELLGLDRSRPVARVRSMARVPGSRDLLALAFVHREVARPGGLRVRGESGEIEVVIEELPFGQDLTPAAEPARKRGTA